MALDSVVPFRVTGLPVTPRSPSQATNPTDALTGPVVGVTNPEIGMLTRLFAASLVISAKPRKICRSRSGAAGLR